MTESVFETEMTMKSSKFHFECLIWITMYIYVCAVIEKLSVGHNFYSLLLIL